MALHGGEGAAEALGDRLEALVRVRGAEPYDLVVVDLTVRRRDAGKGVEVVYDGVGKTTFLKGLKDWAQVFAQFGLGAAAISILK